MLIMSSTIFHFLSNSAILADFGLRNGLSIIGNPDFREISSLKDTDIIILDENCSHDKIKSILTDNLTNFSTPIITSKNVNNPEDFIRLGVINNLPDLDEFNLCNHLEALINCDREKGNILLISEDTTQIKIINNICRSFDFKLTAFKSLDEFYQNKNIPVNSFILLNLNKQDLLLPNFCKYILANKSYASIPIISYTNKIEDLYIHDLFSGLKKMCRYILTTKELYVFLVKFLSRKAISETQHVLNVYYHKNEMEIYSSLSLPQLYFNHSTKLFKTDTINIDDFSMLLKNNNRYLLNLKSLSWILTD